MRLLALVAVALLGCHKLAAPDGGAAGASDLAAPAEEPDLSAAADLAAPPDLRGPRDLAQPPPPDLVYVCGGETQACCPPPGDGGQPCGPGLYCVDSCTPGKGAFCEALTCGRIGRACCTKFTPDPNVPRICVKDYYCVEGVCNPFIDGGPPTCVTP